MYSNNQREVVAKVCKYRLESKHSNSQDNANNDANKKKKEEYSQFVFLFIVASIV